MNPIQVPAEWDDNGILLFEEFCAFIRTPQRTVRDWKRRGIGPRWWRFNGTGRLYTTVADSAGSSPPDASAPHQGSE